MGRAKFLCAYCDKSFEDSQDARKRHFSGRNHRTNVKLWYDGFAEREQKQTAPLHRAGGATHGSPWTPTATQSATDLSPMEPTAYRQTLPPSMIPAPPEAFRQRRRLAEWG